MIKVWNRKVWVVSGYSYGERRHTTKALNGKISALVREGYRPVGGVSAGPDGGLYQTMKRRKHKAGYGSDSVDNRCIISDAVAVMTGCFFICNNAVWSRDEGVYEMEVDRKKYMDLCAENEEALNIALKTLMDDPNARFVFKQCWTEKPEDPEEDGGNMEVRYATEAH